MNEQVWPWILNFNIFIFVINLTRNNHTVAIILIVYFTRDYKEVKKKKQHENNIDIWFFYDPDFFWKKIFK